MLALTDLWSYLSPPGPVLSQRGLSRYRRKASRKLRSDWPCITATPSFLYLFVRGGHSWPQWRESWQSSDILARLLSTDLSLVVVNIAENVFTLNLLCWISSHFLPSTVKELRSWGGQDLQSQASEWASKGSSFSIFMIHIRAHSGLNTENVLKTLWHQKGNHPLTLINQSHWSDVTCSLFTHKECKWSRWYLGATYSH